MNTEGTKERRTKLGPPPLVTVIVPVYLEWERRTLCLPAPNRPPVPDDKFEIIVVNNEAIPRTLEELPPNARLIHEPHPGSYTARNAAVAESRGRYLAFTDSDCIPDADWLKNGLDALIEHPATRIAGRVEIFREKDSSYLAYVYDLHTAFRQDRTVAKWSACATANMMVERAVFDRVGPFYHRFSGGDFEWNLRAKAVGIPIVFAKDVVVEHPARRDLRAIIRKHRRKAGSQLDAKVYRFVLGRMISPLRQVARLRREGVPWGTVLLITTVYSTAALAEILEFGLVRSGIKKPNRS